MTPKELEKAAEEYTEDVYSEYVGKGDPKADIMVIQRKVDCTRDFIAGANFAASTPLETLYRFVKASERHPPEYGKMYIFRRISSGKLYIRLNTASPKGLIRRFTGDIEWLELLPAASTPPQKEEADEFYPGHRYQRIFDYLYSGGLTLLQSEMDDLIQIVRKDFPPEPVDREAVEGYVKSVSVQNKELIEKTVESKKEIERLQASLLDVCEKSAAEVQRLKGLIKGFWMNANPHQTFFGHTDGEKIKEQKRFWEKYVTNHNL